MRPRYSTNWRAAESRIRRLPVLVAKGADSLIKKRASDLVKYFHDGIKGGTFRLKPLTTASIAAKQSRGYEQPQTALYGLGDEDPKRTYANMMEVKKSTSGRKITYTVRPSSRKHHSSKLRLRDLFVVHEYGAIINNAFGVAGMVVRIPPRPAFRYAYRKLMREIASQDPSKTVKQACVRYVRRGDSEALRTIHERSQ